MEISSWFAVVAFLFQFEFYKRRNLVNLSQDLTSGDDTLLVSCSPFPSTFPWRAANEWDEAVKKIRHKAISNMCGLIDGYFIPATSEGRGECATPLGRGVLLFPTLCPSMLAGPHFYRIKKQNQLQCCGWKIKFVSHKWQTLNITIQLLSVAS